MRPIALLTLTLLALCAPAPALAGTFIVPFGSGTSMGLAGWTGKADAGAICGYEGNSTIFLNAGTLPAHSGCFLLFNAPAAAQILAVNVHHGWTKASPATALCAYSFAAQPGDTLRPLQRRHLRRRVRGERLELGRARDLQRERLADRPVDRARQQHRLPQRRRDALGSDGARALGERPDRRPDRDSPRSSAGRPRTPRAARRRWATPSTAGRSQILRGQACSWLCGTGASGTATVDLSGLPDGPHSVTVYGLVVRRRDDDGGPVRLPCRPHGPGRAAAARRRRSGRHCGGLVGTRPDRALDLDLDGRATSPARACASTRRRAPSSATRPPQVR